MEDEELPSESTSSPSFRRNVLKNTTSTNTNLLINSHGKVLGKKVKSTSKTTKKRNSKLAKQSNPRKKNRVIHSTPKSKAKASARILDNVISEDEDMYEGASTIENLPLNNSDEYQNNDQIDENLINLNVSFASDATDTNDLNNQPNTVSKTTNMKKQDVLQYFIKQANGEFQCTLCINTVKLMSKKNELSDTNLRSHLGRIHGMTEYLYPSQQRKKTPRVQHISQQLKNKFDEAAFQAIIQDSHAFNLFRKPGMQHFLSVALPGYHGPHRRTVVKRLQTSYKNLRSLTRLDFSSVSDISLSADMWQNIRRDHFLCLSAHFYDEHYHPKSSIIAFRRFIGSHSGERIEQFITNEIEKLNIKNKICSLTTDNGSDIKSASQNQINFGIRISCLLHVFNLIVQNGLWLFRLPKIKKSIISSTNDILTSATLQPTSDSGEVSSPTSVSNTTELNHTLSSISNTTSSVRSSSTSDATASNRTPSSSSNITVPSRRSSTISNTTTSNRTTSSSTSNTTASDRTLTSSSTSNTTAPDRTPSSSSTSNTTASDRTPLSSSLNITRPNRRSSTMSNTATPNRTSSSTISNTTTPNRTSSSSTSNTTASNRTSSSSINITTPNHTSSLSTSNITKSNRTPSSSISNTTAPDRTPSSSSTMSNTNETVITTIIWSDSSTYYDERYFIMEEDKVSDGMSDDNASDMTNEDSDLGNPSDAASTVTTNTTLSSSSSSSSLSSDKSYTPDSVNVGFFVKLTPSMVATITDEEEFLNKAFADPTILLLKIHTLLKRVRKLIDMIHNSSNLNRYVIYEMKLKIANLNRRINDEDKKHKFKQLTTDMPIRWNSSFVMISRFLFYSSIINTITHYPYNTIKLRPKQCRKLKNLSFTSLDWSILKSLENVLGPFNQSTKILSTRERPTLSICQSVKCALTQFLTIPENAPLTLENLLKNQLLLNFNFYFEKHVTDEQSRATLISSFLDPTTYKFLTCDDKKEAEVIILNEAQKNYAQLNSQASLSISQPSTITKSNKNERDSQSIILQNLFESCGISIETTTPIFKTSTIKEEIAQYIASLALFQTFSDYWSKNNDRLPILSSIVRKYNIMCATSIDCESAFSIAGHIHRKNRSSLAPSALRYSMLLRDHYSKKLV